MPSQLDKHLVKRFELSNMFFYEILESVPQDSACADVVDAGCVVASRKLHAYRSFSCLCIAKVDDKAICPLAWVKYFHSVCNVQMCFRRNSSTKNTSVGAGICFCSSVLSGKIAGTHFFDCIRYSPEVTRQHLDECIEPGRVSKESPFFADPAKWFSVHQNFIAARC